jgi:N-acetylglucosamine repressor
MKPVKSKIEHDKLVIESLVWRHGPISRARIHELTHLQRSNISRLVKELLSEERILPAGRADNPVGRKQLLLRVNEERGFVLAVGFDDEQVLAAVMDLHLRVRSISTETASLGQGESGFINQLLTCARQTIQKTGLEAKSLLGIGVAGSGLVNTREGMLVMSSTIEFLKQVPLREIFEREFEVRTAVENITRAKTVAERALGAGSMANDMIYVEYGRTGIGAGIVIDGKLLYGSGYVAGEFGHTHMIEDGPACKCGSFGCLEAIAGAAALEARIRKAISEGSGSKALSLAAGDPGKITGWTVLKAAGLGDKACGAIVEQAGNYLGLGLANLVNLFNPSVLVVDQRLSMAGEGLLEQILKAIRRQALSHSARDLVVRFGTLGHEASVLGAGRIVLENHFEIPALKPPRFMIEPAQAPLRHAAVARVVESRHPATKAVSVLPRRTTDPV